MSGGIHGNMEVVEIFHRGPSQAICPSSRPLLCTQDDRSNLQVAHHTKRSENNTCEIQLTCSVENPNDNASFRWQVAGIPYHSETNLSISWDPKSLSEETHTCIAENPVSFLSSSVSDKSVCEGKSVSGLSEDLECCGGVGCHSCPLWFLKQWPNGRQLSDVGRGQTPHGALCLLLL